MFWRNMGYDLRTKQAVKIKFNATWRRLLLPPGQQQAVVKQVEVHWLGGQLEFWSRNAHHLGVHFQELTVLHQPAGLGDERKDLQRKKTRLRMGRLIG